MAGFIYKLQNIINTTPEHDDTDVNIARCLLKNIHQIQHKNSLSELSELCYTSQSSISRFAHKLGYTNFSEFKLDIINTQEELNEMIIDTNAHHQFHIQNFSLEICQSLQSINQLQLTEDIEILCQYIHNAHRIFIFATHIPGDMANIMQRAFLTTGKFVEFYPQKEHQIKIAKHISKNDLCIFISLEGMLLMEKSITIPAIISLCKNVLITQNPQIKFANQFSQVISLGEHDNENIGKYKLLFFIDLLLNAYYHHYVYCDEDHKL